MILVCQQPNYFAWLGYFEQQRVCDAFVLLDDVQWIRQGWQHRSRILSHKSNTQNQNYQWITLPTMGHGHRDKALKDLRLDPEVNWQKKHWSTIQAVYAKHPFFKSQLEPILRPWFEGKASEFKFMIDAAWASNLLFADILQCQPLEIKRSSEFSVSNEKTERLINLCQIFNADKYYTPLGTATYLDANLFREAGIRVYQQNWKHPIYTQGPLGIAQQCTLSIIDVVANNSFEEIREWITPKSWGPFPDKSTAPMEAH